MGLFQMTCDLLFEQLKLNQLTTLFPKMRRGNIQINTSVIKCGVWRATPTHTVIHVNTQTAAYIFK